MERFWNKVKKSNSCWEWIAQKNYKGYGQFWANGKGVKAHRFSYELHKGKIPEGLQIDHLCKNTSCVNPDHLEAVTCKENINRGNSYNGLKTHCPSGHDYNYNNTYMTKERHRKCRECHRIQSRIYRGNNT